MPGEWLIMVKEKEEVEVLYSYRIIIIDVDFQERKVEFTDDNCKRSNMIISTYSLVEKSQNYSQNKMSPLAERKIQHVFHVGLPISRVGP